MTVHSAFYERTRLIGQLQLLTKPRFGGVLLSAVYSCRVALRLPGLRIVFCGLFCRVALCLPGLRIVFCGLFCRVALRLPGLRIVFLWVVLPGGALLTRPANCVLWVVLPGGASLTRPTNGVLWVALAGRFAYVACGAWRWGAVVGPASLRRRASEKVTPLLRLTAGPRRRPQ